MINWLREQKNRNRLRFFTYSVYTVLVFLIGLLLISFLGLIDFSNKGLDESFIFNKRPTVIITGSMVPAVEVNSIVMIEPVDFKDIVVGDIVRYQSDKGYSVLHRVIHKTVSYVTTKGDANEKADPFAILPEQITGRVVEIHNEYAEPLTSLFGSFDYSNPSIFFIRVFLVFILIALGLFVLVISFVFIFELITINYFFRKHGEDLVIGNNYWLEKLPTIQEQDIIVKEYFLSYQSSKFIRKIVLAAKFRRYYNGLCNIEKEVLKTNKRLLSLKRSERID